MGSGAERPVSAALAAEIANRLQGQQTLESEVQAIGTAIPLTTPYAVLATDPAGSGDAVEATWFRTPISVERSSDSSTKSATTTPTADDQLVIQLAAGARYFFVAQLRCKATNAAMDAKYGWTYPSGCAMDWGVGGAPNANAGGYGTVATGTTPNPNAIETGTVPLGSVNGIVGHTLTGFIDNTVGSAGPLALLWAQNTSDAGTIQLLKYSFVELRRRG